MGHAALDLRGPQMVRVPGGDFPMGLDRHYPKEVPAHRVRLDASLIDRTAKWTTDWYLMSALTSPDQARVGPDKPVMLELVGGRAVYRGDRNAILITSRPSGIPPEPVATRKWHLYNLAKDPGETTDLAAEQPQVLAELAAAYDAQARDNGVISLPGMFEDIFR